MPSLRVPVLVPRDGRRVLRKVVLVKATDLPADQTNYYDFKVGAVNGSRFTSFGRFDGARNRINAGGSFTLFDGERSLGESDVVALDAVKAGSPVPLYDAALQVTTAFRVEARGMDPALSSFLQDSGALERDTVLGLGGLFGGGVYAVDAYDSGTQTVSATSFTNGNVSITFTKPSWATVGYAKVDASSDVLGNGGTGIAHAAVGDGTTDHNEKAVTSLTTQGIDVTTFFAGTITGTTTFTLRLKRTTNNVDFSRQVIAGFAAWT